MGRRFLFILFNFLMRTLTRFEVHGQENIPAHGPALVVINHLGRLDAAILFISVPRPDITGWVAEKYQRSLLMRLLVWLLEGIWINRFETDRMALKTGVDWMKNGGLLGIAPEGTRSPTGALIAGKPGAAYVADMAGVAILPAGIVTPADVVRKALTFRRPPVSITYGQPFRLPPLARASRERQLAEHTDEIMCRIAALLPPELHGVYTGHPRLAELHLAEGNAAVASENPV